MRTMTILSIFAMLLSLAAPAMAMGNKPQAPDAVSSAGSSASAGTGGGGSGGSGGDGGSVGDAVVSTVNTVGNDDRAQQAAGHLGELAVKGGMNLINDGIDRGLNQGATPANAQAIINNGTRIVISAGAVQVGATAAPFVGAVSTSAGYAAEGNAKGALIQGVNGVTRSYAVAKVGGAAAAAGTIWATGKLGAVAGSWAGPLGTATGFVLGVGAAYLGGKIWDATVGAGADALTQKAADYDAQSQYGVDKSDFEGQTVAGETRDITRTNAQQQARDSIRTSRPSGGGGSGGCGGSCGR